MGSGGSAPQRTAARKPSRIHVAGKSVCGRTRQDCDPASRGSSLCICPIRRRMPRLPSARHEDPVCGALTSPASASRRSILSFAKTVSARRRCSERMPSRTRFSMKQRGTPTHVAARRHGSRTSTSSRPSTVPVRLHVVRSDDGRVTPRHLSTDHDPLFEAHRWTANLRILEIDEIKTVPHVPLSHPFVERLIGTMRREFLDHVLFWNARDLERKLGEFQTYYNAARCHASLKGHTPATFRRWTHEDPCRSEPRALGLPLQGPRPAPSRRLTTNSRRTGCA